MPINISVSKEHTTKLCYGDQINSYEVLHNLTCNKTSITDIHVIVNEVLII